MVNRKRKTPEKSEPKKVEEPAKKTSAVLTRRNLVIGSMAAILGGTAFTLLRPKEQTEAERFLQEFPDAIPGASAGIRKYEVPGAHKCLVHIRNAHGMEYMIDERFQPIISRMPMTSQIIIHRALQGESLDDMDYPWLDEETKKLMEELLETEAMREVIEIRQSLSEEENEENKNIEKIVSYFGEEHGIRYLYFEELNEYLAEFANNYGEHRSTTEEEIRRMSDELSMSVIASDARIALQKKLWHQQAVLEMLDFSSRETFDELLPLVASGELEVRGALDEALVEKAVQNIESGVSIDDPEHRDVTFELRERAVLALPCREAIKPVRYGGDHQWWDTIQEWNKEHPNDMYSLIEITPDGYDIPKDDSAKVRKNSIERTIALACSVLSEKIRQNKPLTAAV